MNKRTLSRRLLLKAGCGAGFAALAGPTIVPASALGRGRPAPSERIRVGFIGVGWKGLQGCYGSLVHSFLANPVCQALAVCDVNAEARARAKRTIDERRETRTVEATVIFDSCSPVTTLMPWRLQRRTIGMPFRRSKRAVSGKTSTAKNLCRSPFVKREPWSR